MNIRLRNLFLLLLSILLAGMATATFAQAENEFDWGDAPDNGDNYRYATLVSSDGARHAIDEHFYLGKWSEEDADGQPDLNAEGDDRLDGTDDEDGAIFSILRSGATAQMGVMVSEDGFLNLWIDYNRDGDWDDSNEYVLQDQLVIIGSSTQQFVVPVDVAEGPSYARVRYSAQPLADQLAAPPYYLGEAGAGEVEDYVVRIEQSRKDRFEPNDTRAFDLGSLNQERYGLTLESKDDVDLFEWTALHNDDSAEISLNFTDTDGQVLMQLFDAAGALVGEQEASNGSGSFRFSAEAGKTYTLRLQSLIDLVPDYEIAIWPGSTCKNYAVLFAGGSSSGGNYNRYYNNIKALYETLVDQYKLTPSNIYILYADGTDPAIDLEGTTNSDMTYATSEGATVLAGTRPNLEQVLTIDLPAKIDDNDNLLFYAFDHGGGSTNAATTGEEYLTGYGLDAPDHDVAAWLSHLDYGYLTNVHAQCFAGGMIDDVQPTAFNHFAMAATNHYEYSYGDGFAAAFVDALQAGKTKTNDAYIFTHDNDPYAKARGSYSDNGGAYQYGKEHPWAASSANFPIFCAANNKPWWMDIILVHRFVPPWDEVMLPFDTLVAKSQIWSEDLDALSFRVETVDDGVLLKDGVAVVPGETTVGIGETLVWQPSGRAIAGGDTVYPFTLRATDGSAVSDNSAAFPINFYEGGAELNAEPDTLEVVEDDTQAVLNVLDNDSGNGTLVLLGVGQPKHGSAEIINGKLHYTPAPNFNGVDEFSYTIGDSSQENDSAIVKINIVPDNDVPDANQDNVIVVVNGSAVAIAPLINDLDADNDILSAALAPIRTAGHGTVVDNGNNTFSYTPDAGYSGPDSFDYLASDGTAEAQGTVYIDVIADNTLDWGDAPEFPPQYGAGYRTTLGRDGARHTIGGPWLGGLNDAPDGDGDGNPESTAQGDNSSVSNDENGFTLGSSAVVGNQTTLNVEVNGAAPTAVVQVWIDWDQNLQWDADEMIVNAPYTNGTHAIAIEVPVTAVLGDTFARFRISRAGGLESSGAAPDGEVEDHKITVYQTAPTAVQMDGIAVENRPILPYILIASLLLLVGMTIIKRSYE